MRRPVPVKAPASAKPGAVDQVCHLIRQRIISGRYAPGQRLVVRELEEQMGFSRSTFREALRRLEAEKLLNLVPNVGASVQQLNKQELVDLFQLCELLVCFATRLAASRIDEGDNRRRFIEMCSKIVRKGVPERQVFVEQNELFFATIYKISGNSRISDTLTKLQVHILLAYWRQVMTHSDIELAIQDHERIIEAILEGRPDRAETAMRRYLRRNRQRTFELFDVADANERKVLLAGKGRRSGPYRAPKELARA
jgi:DNA-binding GntR family transcriptional regulator